MAARRLFRNYKEPAVNLRSCCVAWIGLLLLAAIIPAADEGLFPFVVSYDAPKNATNVDGWLHKPAGKHGFVRSEQGRLTTDAGPQRFWATNLCFDACFPEHDQAQRVAARLARLGINCVRLHHMDNHAIWGSSKNKLTIDPKKQERLDYLIYQLKLHGVYVNINLHVSRWLDAAEGFPNREGRPDYDKGVGNFDPRMIEAQKQYARDLLTHVNPYTKTAYVDEPAVAFVEISNEDALFAVWGWGQLDNLPEPYAGTYRQQWNAWLQKKYGSTEKLKGAWNVGATALGKELLTNGDFARPVGAEWYLERDEQTKAAMSVVAGQGKDQPPRFLRLNIEKKGRVAWNPQLGQPGFVLKKDSPYTLAFKMRAEKPGRASVNCMMAHEPWERLGLSADIKLTAQWKTYRYTFVAERDDPKARITFTEFQPGAYELAEVSLRPGGVAGLEPGLSLEEQNIPVLRRNEMHLTKAARADFIDFLWDTEKAYWHGMYRYVKDELGVKSLVTGTQLNYGPAHIQAGLDFIDSHSYWHHPTFPGRPWDSNDWYVHDAALVNSPGGTLARLAASRVEGKAYTVSEYNHPAPIHYAAEGFPMIAAFGAHQRWDGIYSFAYSHNDRFEPRKLESFFDIKGDPSRLVHHPACAAMFVRGDVSPAKETVLVPMSAAAERRKLHETMSAWTLNAGDLGCDNHVSLLHALALDLSKDGAVPDPKLEKDIRTFVSDTGEIRWDVSETGAGYFTVDAPRTKLFTGFGRGRSFKLGDAALRLGATKLDWATVSMVALDGKDFRSPGRVLIAATGLVKNSGAEVEKLGDDRITLRNRWGNEPVLCEGVAADLLLPVAADRVTLYPLDESGNRRAAVPVSERGGKAMLQLSPAHKTLWYEAEIR